MNHFPEEAPIITRLKTKLADGALLTALGVASIKVASIASIVGLVDIGALLPAVFLAPGASEAGSSRSDDSRAVLEDVQWEAIVVMAVTPDPVQLNTDYSKAGLLIGAVVEALAGWKPLSAYREMRYAGRGEPQLASRHTEFPIRFIVRRGLTFSGE